MRKPYLIQRMILKDNVPKNPSIDELYSMDYMGSAEFKFGSLPASLKKMTKTIDEIKVGMVKEYKNHKGQRLFLIGLEKDILEYQKFTPDLVDGKIRLKEWTMLDGAIKGETIGIEYNPKRHPSAWWDIDNQVMFTFGKKNAINLWKAIKKVRDKKKDAGEDSWY